MSRPKYRKDLAAAADPVAIARFLKMPMFTQQCDREHEITIEDFKGRQALKARASR